MGTPIFAKKWYYISVSWTHISQKFGVFDPPLEITVILDWPKRLKNYGPPPLQAGYRGRCGVFAHFLTLFCQTDWKCHFFFCNLCKNWQKNSLFDPPRKKPVLRRGVGGGGDPRVFWSNLTHFVNLLSNRSHEWHKMCHSRPRDLGPKNFTVISRGWGPEGPRGSPWTKMNTLVNSPRYG